MKYLYTYILAGILFVTYVVIPRAEAAFNDLTLETTAIIEVNGYELTVYGSSAVLQEMVVGPTTVAFTLASGSSVTIASADRLDLSNDAASTYIASEVCNDTESRLGLSSSSGTVTVTVTPSGTCTPAAVASSGGGTTFRKVKAPVTVPPVEIDTESSIKEQLIAQLKSLIAQFIALGGTPTPELLALVGGSADVDFTRDLDLGMEGDDVMKLQNFLVAQNKGPAAQALAAHGVTDYFGPLTQAALAEFQAAVGITPAVGYFGPVTRSYVNNL